MIHKWKDINDDRLYVNEGCGVGWRCVVGGGGLFLPPVGGGVYAGGYFFLVGVDGGGAFFPPSPGSPTLAVLPPLDFRHDVSPSLVQFTSVFFC